MKKPLRVAKPFGDAQPKPDAPAMEPSGSSNQNALFAADVVSAFVMNNSLPRGELPSLIAEVHNAFVRLGEDLEGSDKAGADADALSPAVPPNRSVTRDRIICLDCGRRFKSLKRHLKAEHELSAEQYRKKWKLPLKYPMVTSAYSVTRATLAKEMGLGKRRKEGNSTTRRSARVR